MRVLMLAWEYPPHVVGGMGKHVAELVPALAAQGVHIHVLTPCLREAPAEEFTPEGVHVQRVDLPAGADDDLVGFVQRGNRSLLAAAWQAHENHSFDLIHVHDWLTADGGVELKHAWRRPLVATIHATERGRGQGRLVGALADHIHAIEWRLTYEAWRVITCSRFMATQVSDYFAAPPDKIDVIPNGINLQPNPFQSAEERLAFRRQYADDDQPLVFHVGRIVYEKGVQILIEAWRSVQAVKPGARLVIAGAGSYLHTLQARVEELELGATVRFAGFISDGDRERLFHSADLAVFPSLYEPFGIVALEAMAASCPVIVSDTGGLGEVILQRHNGIKVPTGRPDLLASAILESLSEPELACERAANAFADARDTFSWSHIARETIRSYRHTQEAWAASEWGE